MQFIKVEFLLAVLECIYNALRYALIEQMPRARGGLIQFPIDSSEA
jgi:hypothetical protein